MPAMQCNAPELKMLFQHVKQATLSKSSTIPQEKKMHQKASHPSIQHDNHPLH
jgi:hypothetical protein